VPVEKDFLAPKEPLGPPYDTACPTGVRNKEIDEKYLLEMHRMMESSAVTKAAKKLSIVSADETFTR
jgi:hypothetical protein